MPYLDQKSLMALGFSAVGKNVKISDKAAIYNADQITIGDHSRIDDFCVLSGRITIGRNVHIAAQSLIAGGTPGVTLDDFSGMAYGAKIFSQSDDYSGATLTNPTVPLEYKAEIKAAAYIGRHVILGANAIVAPGVWLAEGCCVGAGAVVLKSMPPWSVIAGVPARVIKARKQDLLELERAYLQKDQA